jgi:hypothetical protein
MHFSTYVLRARRDRCGRPPRTLPAPAAAGFGFFARRIERHRRANERFERPFVDLVAFMKIDSAPDIAVEA